MSLTFIKKSNKCVKDKYIYDKQTPLSNCILLCVNNI